MKLGPNQIEQLNEFDGFLSFKQTWAFKKFIHRHERLVALFTGNQFGKTAGVAFSYVMRILGVHPIPVKNVLYFECSSRVSFMDMEEGADKERLRQEYREQHPIKECYGDTGTFGINNLPDVCPCCGSEVIEHQRDSRVFRFCSQTLPGGGTKGDDVSVEVKNTQYPAFKKWLPAFMIKKDTTFRDHYLVIEDPHGRGDIIVEFVSYNQPTQATAGVQRLSVWYDEEPSLDFRNEQIPRLLAEGGDEVVTLTPANYISWMYDEIYEKASVYIRTPAIRKFLLETDNQKIGAFERVESTKSIAVIQAATDDNPTLQKDDIEALFDNIDDPDTLAIRRFGLFKQVSGRIFKDFEYGTHFISKKEWFPDGIPFNWTHARGIDYHPQTPWACGAISLSPENEAFIWLEFNPSPEKYTVEEIADRLNDMCGDYKFNINLIDPLSEAHKRVDFGRSITVRDDFNSAFLGFGRKGYWHTWDTKGEKGRDEVRKRLKNAKKCGTPFNNKVIGKSGKIERIPTIWVLTNCKISGKSMRQWRWEEFADSKSIQVKEAKNKPEQRWSHFNMVWEAIFKNSAFRPTTNKKYRNTHRKNYF